MEGSDMDIQSVSEPTAAGGNGWVASRVSESLLAAQNGLVAASANWSRPPIVGPHPRDVALAAARDAVAKINDALSVEAPEDAIEDTRHALEELSTAIAAMEKGSDEPPTPHFERSIALLRSVEERLATATSGYG